jgi:PAS domain S-box-containing protein
MMPMKPIDELMNLIGPALAQMEARDAERIEKSIRRIEKHAELQEKKIHRAILDRQAVHSLMTRTAGDLAKRYQALFEQDSNPKIIIEKDGTISLANNSFCHLIHEQRGDVENKKNICDYLDGMICDPLTDDAASRDDISPPDLSTGQIHTAGGEFIDVLINQGSFPGSSQSIVTLINVSERMRLERKLLETSGFLSGILRASPVGFHMTDSKGDYVYVNETWTAITGFLPDQVMGKYYSIILHPDDRERITAKLRESDKRKVGREIEARIIRPDGSVRWIFQHSVPVIDDGGQLTGWVGAISDITERKEIERELEENRAYLEKLVTSVQVGILVIEADTHRIIDANPAALAMIGLQKPDVLGHICHNYVCPTQAGQCPITDLGMRIENAERILIHADGRRIPIIKHVIPVILHGKKFLLETFIDNTYRKKMEEALKESEEKYRALTENTGDVLYSVDLEGNITYVSPQVNRYGYTQEEAINVPLSVFVHPLDLATVKKALASEARNRTHEVAIFRIFSKDGNIHWLEGKSTLRIDAAGNPMGFLGILRDVTDRKHAEDAIALANRKLNLMNNVTRHDILNTITGVYGYIDMANATLSVTEREQLLRDVKDLVGIIQRQINFTKQYQEVGIREPQWQRVAAVIESVIPNFSRAGLKFAIDLDRLEIYADPLLEKVFYNLIDNAVRYGDTLTTISVRFDLIPAGLSIIVEDDGVGIPAEEKERVFERGIGRNTGLGLFMTREILGITGIAISENGEPGKGARFTLIVPRGAYRLADDQ